MRGSRQGKRDRGMGSSLLLTHLYEKRFQKTIIFSFTDKPPGFGGSELTTKSKVGGESRADLTPCGQKNRTK